ncbi:hypothetical protein ACROYT_G035531 [Oculina patagonica]
MRSEVTSLKKSVSFTQSEVDTLKEKAKENTKEMKDGLDDLSLKVAQLEKKLESTMEENIRLEQLVQYTPNAKIALNGEETALLVTIWEELDFGAEFSERVGDSTL